MAGQLAAIMRTSRRGPVIPAPYRAAWRHTPTFFGKLAMERWLLVGRAMPVRLKTLASLRAASMVGCVW